MFDRGEIMTVTNDVRKYLAEIGRCGGRKSRRRLSSDQARDMVRVREARRAFREFHAQCFWYMAKDAKITLADVPEVVRALRQNGGRRGFLLAARLCR
jgi:hypothetical protein